RGTAARKARGVGCRAGGKARQGQPESEGSSGNHHDAALALASFFFAPWYPIGDGAQFAPGISRRAVARSPIALRDLRRPTELSNLRTPSPPGSVMLRITDTIAIADWAITGTFSRA